MSDPHIFRSLPQAAEQASPCALAIGNFDGVHLGHRSLLKNTVELAQERHITPAVLTFDPHPTTVVAPERTPEKLCSLEDRLRLLDEAGAQEITVLPFTAETARLSPEDFVRRILVDTLNVKLVVVGENFRFGFQQAGTAQTLTDIGKQLGFEAYRLPPVLSRGEIVSSSAIRRYLVDGDISHANRLLGRCFSLSGPVISGHGIGSRQTVPTLNLEPSLGQLTPRGVFVTETTEIATGRNWQSITNVGTRPTFNGDQLTIETFLLSPFEEPSPQEIRVEFRRFIRPERAFPDPQSLRAQIMLDVDRAKAYWRRVGGVSKAAPSIY